LVRSGGRRTRRLRQFCREFVVRENSVSVMSGGSVSLRIPNVRMPSWWTNVADFVVIWQGPCMNEIEAYKSKVMCSSIASMASNQPSRWFSLRGAIFFGIGMLLGYLFIGI
jgi:hypothetical protein